MKFYIASHSQEEAIVLGNQLEDLGHTVCSSWLGMRFLPTSQMSDDECERIAEIDLHDVFCSDALVLLSGPEKYSGGKFVEFGVAMAMNKHLFIIGRRENIFGWYRKVHRMSSNEELILWLREKKWESQIYEYQEQKDRFDRIGGPGWRCSCGTWNTAEFRCCRICAWERGR